MGTVINLQEELAQSSKMLRSSRTMYQRYAGAVEKQAKPQMRQKDVTTTNAQYAHGPQGVFNTPGIDPAIFSAIVRPRGISSLLPLVASQSMTPLFEIITGQTANSGTEPATECGLPVQAGNLLVGFLTAPFGRVMRKTPNLLVNRLGQIVNNAEPLDLRVANSVNDTSPWIPDPAKNPDFLNTEIGKQEYSLGLEMERTVEPIMFTGNQNRFSAPLPDEGYREWAGFDQLINTGKIDAITGMLIPAADPLIVNWNNALASGTTPLNGTNADIVTTMGAIANYLYSKAERMNMLPVNWAIVMRYDTFFELTRIWPCSYLTNACTTAVLNGGTQFVQASDQVEMRDDMRSNHFLWINGMHYPVIISDGIAETAAGGGSSSGIYFIPLSANGFLTTYINYFDFSNAMLTGAIDSGLLGRDQFTVTNGGLYLWTFERTQYCEYLVAKTEPRLVLRVPWLAARLQNVVIQTAIHSVDGFLTPPSLYPAPNGGSQIGTFGGALYQYAV